jgi:hypothetical protein
MEDLSGQYPAHLAPSSMEGGNLTTPPEQVALAMTAPGSPPVTPMPAPGEASQLPQPQLGPVYRPPNRVSGAGPGAGEGGWASVDNPQPWPGS